MLKKFIAVLLVATFTNVYAATPIQHAGASAIELNKAFDSLNYKLNVEWDQKDSQFFDATLSEFEKEISNLQHDGVTMDEVINFTKEKIKDKQIQNDINELTSIVAHSKMSNEEARAFIVSKLNSTYANGASWQGRRSRCATAIIVGVVLIAAYVHFNCNDNIHGPCSPIF